SHQTAMHSLSTEVSDGPAWSAAAERLNELVHVPGLASELAVYRAMGDEAVSLLPPSHARVYWMTRQTGNLWDGPDLPPEINGPESRHGTLDPRVALDGR